MICGLKVQSRCKSSSSCCSNSARRMRRLLSISLYLKKVKNIRGTLLLHLMPRSEPVNCVHCDAGLQYWVTHRGTHALQWSYSPYPSSSGTMCLMWAEKSGLLQTLHDWMEAKTDCKPCACSCACSCCLFRAVSIFRARSINCCWYLIASKCIGGATGTRCNRFSSSSSFCSRSFWCFF